MPLTPGRAGTTTGHDRRHGTTDPFVSVNVATGEVIYDTKPRHRGKEVLAFLELIDRHPARHLDVHVVLDHLSAHDTSDAAAWLARAHPKRARWHLDFTPTSSQWLNLVEGCFNLLTRGRLHRGTFSSVDELPDERVRDVDNACCRLSDRCAHRSSARGPAQAPRSRRPSRRSATLTRVSELEQRLAVLADKDEIRELTARYCFAVADGDANAIVDMFTDDGVFMMRGKEFRGRAGLQEMYDGAAVSPPRPFIQNHVIEVNGDDATGRCAVEIRLVVKEQAYTAAGHYFDTYRRVDGHWKFAARDFRVWHWVPLAKGWA